MNYFSFLIRKFLDSYRDTKKVVNFFELYKWNDSLIYIKIFVIKFFYSFSKLRNFKKIKLSKKSSSYFEFLSEKKFITNETLNQIDMQGYSKIYNLKQDMVLKFKDFILNSNKHDKPKNSNIAIETICKNLNENYDQYFLRLKSLRISRITGAVDLNSENIITSFLFSEPIIDIVKNYLDSNNISVSASYFISIPSSDITEKDKIHNAQYFHWDNDFTKFCKLYIYLSNVDNDSGPHIYVEGTHKKKLFKHSLHRSYSDIDVRNSYNKIKTFVGNQGSLFFVDSYGLHKGDTPRSNHRIMLNVHYGKGKILYSKYDKFIKIIN